tara:strand:+ start:546 stop:650 length:105 start_codon:yes stop_codon:yes gene_type:complete
MLRRVFGGECFQTTRAFAAAAATTTSERSQNAHL